MTVAPFRSERSVRSLPGAAGPLAAALRRGLLFVGALASAAIAAAQPASPVTEVDVGGEPSAILTATDGTIWSTDRIGLVRFVNPGNGSQGAFVTTPHSGQPDAIVQQIGGTCIVFTLPPNSLDFVCSSQLSTVNVANTRGVEGIATLLAHPDIYWITDPSTNQIVERTCTDGCFGTTPFDITPKTPLAVTAGPDDAIWFTYLDPVGGDGVGRLPSNAQSTADASFFPTGLRNASGLNIVVGPDNNLWFGTLDGIGSMNTSGAVVRRVPMPSPFQSRVNGISGGPDGNIWFTAGAIGRMTTAGQILNVLTPPTVVSPPRVRSLEDIASGPGNTMVYTDTGGFLGQIDIANVCAKPAPVSLRVNGSPSSTSVTGGEPYVLNWTAVTGASGYQLLRSVDGAEFANYGAPTTFTSLSIATSAANVGHDYAFLVVVNLACGTQSDPSNIVDVSVVCGPAAVPQFTSAGGTVGAGESFTLTWNATLNGAGQYHLTLSRDHGAPSDLATVPYSQTSYVYTTLVGDANHTLTFRVQAIAACGSASAFGDPIDVAVTTPCTEAPSGPASANIQSHDGGPVTGVDPLDLSWTPVDPPPANYLYMLNGGAEQSVAGSVTSVTVPPTATEGREPTDPITLSVVAANACGRSEPTLAEPVAPAAPVASFLVSDVDGLSATFTEGSSPQATSWLWLFGDASNPETAHSVTHTYPAAGVYNVWLIASNGAGSSLATQLVSVGLGPAASATARAASLRRPLDATDRERQRLAAGELTGPNRSWWIVTSLEPVETIVFLRLKDADGGVVRERRLSVQPGQEARFDLAAYGLSGTFGLEVVSMQKFTAALEERPPDREISLVPRRGPTRREDPRE